VAFFVSLFIMLGLQAVCLRIFVLVTRVPMYRLAIVILAYCAIGIFALNNIVFDLWVLLVFGVLGYAMRRYGFPLAPMILGVVLGDNAEINLIRALATDSDLTIFFTRPWSLFFLMIAAFSTAFPWYQKHRGRRKWTLFFMPAMALSLSLPLALMEGVFRPSVAAALFLTGVFLLYRRHRGGWALDPSLANDHQLREG
jgi:putative tricarboxylic transport membrane protein